MNVGRVRVSRGSFSVGSLSARTILLMFFRSPCTKQGVEPRRCLLMTSTARCYLALHSPWLDSVRVAMLVYSEVLKSVARSRAPGNRRESCGGLAVVFTRG